MEQQIIRDYPPMIAEIDNKFNVMGKKIIYSWGNKLYNPNKLHVTDALAKHEAFHGDRQEEYGVENWWKLYLADSAFRLHEEVFAHAIEYHTMSIDPVLSRHQRRVALKQVAQKLASPLYGSLLSTKGARKLILNEVHKVST